MVIAGGALHEVCAFNIDACTENRQFFAKFLKKKIAVFVSILTSPDELLCGKNFAIEEICETKEKSVAEILIQKGGLTAIWVLKDVFVIFLSIKISLGQHVTHSISELRTLGLTAGYLNLSPNRVRAKGFTVTQSHMESSQEKKLPAGYFTAQYSYPLDKAPRIHSDTETSATTPSNLLQNL